MKSVLLLDDSTDLLLLEKLLVEKRCHSQALTATSFADILKLGSKVFECDLAILDINLGVNQPSGVDVYHWLRENGFKKPIYFLTGHARSFSAVVEAEKIGDVKILSKPINPKELLSVIRGTDETAHP